MTLLPKILLGFIVLTYLLFLGLHFAGYSKLAYYLSSAILPLYAILFALSIKRRSLFFCLFVYIFALSDFAGLFSSILPPSLDYYLGNTLYIVAYSFLLIKLLRSVNFKSVWQNFRIHLIVLFLFSCYVLFELHLIFKSTYANYVFEFIYNGVLVSMLCSAIINYFYRDDKKSLFLLVGSILIVGYEITGIAFLYFTQEFIISIISTSFLLLAFFFFYQQARINYSDNKESNYIIEKINEID